MKRQPTFPWIKGGIHNYSLSQSLIQTLTPGDNAFILDNDRKILPNIGFGIYYFTQSLHRFCNSKVIVG